MLIGQRERRRRLLKGTWPATAPTYAERCAWKGTREQLLQRPSSGGSRAQRGAFQLLRSPFKDCRRHIVHYGAVQRAVAWSWAGGTRGTTQHGQAWVSNFDISYRIIIKRKMLTIVSYQTTLDIINIISNIEKNITINRYQRRNIDISALVLDTRITF